MEELPVQFPQVLFVSSPENSGFSKACNLGASYAKGTVLLFLNPDTIIPEDCFSVTLPFLEAHPRAGALGVRMVDENGRFLKESKRGFPSPAVSFYKMTGLAALFPRSRTFARYYLGHLSDTENHEVEVLSGAFLMVKRDVFEIVQGFDERFFMYAEDIDLSHRIRKAGYVNCYFAGCTIIHYKGKSTAKNLSYVKQFYHAMEQFTEKQYGKRSLYTLLLKAGIRARAALSMAAILIKNSLGK